MSDQALPRIVVDALPARSDDAVARAADLITSLPQVPASAEYRFLVNRRVLEALRSVPPRHVARVPRLVHSVPGRVLWQQASLPARLAAERVAWLLSLHNVLPVFRERGPVVRQAVVVSSIAAFAPQAWIHHRGYQDVRNRAVRTLTAASVRRADRVFFPSRESHVLLGMELPDGKVGYLPPALPTPAVVSAAERMTPPQALLQRPFFVVASDLYPYEGIEDAILAISKLRVKVRDARLIICGRAMDRRYARRLRAMAERHGHGAVKFLGSLPRPMVMAVMKRSVATITCSRIGESTRVPIDAMVMGTPVIAADTPITLEACGDAAAYYAATEYGDLAASMEDVLGREHIRRFLIQRGKERISTLDCLGPARAILDSMELLRAGAV